MGELIKMMTPKYTLDNGEERHAESPETFWMPPRRCRESLKPGEFVKCIFLLLPSDRDEKAPSGERMWIEIERVRDDGTYLGRLNNIPMFIDARLNDLVSFAPEHIIEIQYDEQRNVIVDDR